MQTSLKGLGLVERFEGFRPVQYDDGTGVATIGYGTTAADVSPLPTRLTPAQAQALLVVKLRQKYEPAVNGIGVPLNQNQFDALVSLAYNCGPGVVGTGYQIGRDLRARNYKAASADFSRYVYDADGRRLQGLVNRRTVERALFDSPPPPPPDPHGYLRFASPAANAKGLRGGPFDSPFGHLDERALVLSYDGARQHWIKDRAYLNDYLRPRLLYLANRLVTLAHELPAGSKRDAFWSTDDRGWRQGQLRDRAGGKRFA